VQRRPRCRNTRSRASPAHRLGSGRTQHGRAKQQLRLLNSAPWTCCRYSCTETRHTAAPGVTTGGCTPSRTGRSRWTAAHAVPARLRLLPSAAARSAAGLRGASRLCRHSISVRVRSLAELMRANAAPSQHLAAAVRGKPSREPRLDRTTHGERRRGGTNPCQATTPPGATLRSTECSRAAAVVPRAGHRGDPRPHKQPAVAALGHYPHNTKLDCTTIHVHMSCNLCYN
jgi:hypothetical protein